MLNLKYIRDLLGKKITLYLFLALAIGVILFLVEYLFVFALQGFLITLGVSNNQTLPMPHWFPNNVTFFYIFFVVIGSSRVIFMQLKIYLGRMTNQVFLRQFRESILSYSIRNASLVSSHETFGLFSDTLSRAGSVMIEGTGIIMTILTTVLLIITGFIKAPYEMLIGMLFLVSLVWPMKKLSRLSLLAGNSLSQNWDKTTKILFEGLRHHYFFKAHDLVEDQVDKGLSQIANYEANYNRYFIITSIKNALPQILGILLIIILSFMGKNYFHTSGPALIAFLYIFLRVSQSGSEIFSTYSNIIFNYSSLIELKKWSDSIREKALVNSVKDENQLTKISTVDTIEFKKVHFSYSSTPLLADINLDLKKGDILLIEAPSGSGKSTLVGLLLNIINPMEGDVFINNINTKDISGTFRDYIAYVGPEPFLFNDTVRQNLVYGHRKNHSATDEEIWRALDLAHASEIIMKLDHKLDEVLYEHTQLSTGQKQRLSLARAILRQSDVLILDESTANLDHEIESMIKDNLAPYLKTKICIIIAHKGTLKNLANKVLKL